MSSLFPGRVSIRCRRVCSMDQAGRVEGHPDRNDPEAFQRLAEPFRRELKLHCYRMLGSLSDAEDLVQETFLRAWRALDEFEGRGQFRSWLYRIATNACLNALAGRASARRVLPESQGPPSDRMPARRAGQRDCLARTLPRPRPGGHCRYGPGSGRALRVARDRAARLRRRDPAPAASAAGRPSALRRHGLVGKRNGSPARGLRGVDQQRPAARSRHFGEAISQRPARVSARP